MKKISWISLPLSLVLLLSTTALVVAAANSFNPVKKADGNNINEVIDPVVEGKGDSAEVLKPNEVVSSDTGIGPEGPFIPGILDDDPFVDMEDNNDYSTQYDYSNAKLSSAMGLFQQSEGTYTASSTNVLYVNRDATTPFPYGKISADIKNNGSDTGLVFGLSSNIPNFWEGQGISYYFVFISQGGTVYIGGAINGGWTNFGEATISGYNAQNTYNLKVLYRGNKIVCYLDGVNVLGISVPTKLTGTGWGIRAGKAGTVISNVKVSSDTTVE